MGVKWGKVPEGDEQEYKGYQCRNLVRKENDNENLKGRWKQDLMEEERGETSGWIETGGGGQ